MFPVDARPQAGGQICPASGGCDLALLHATGFATDGENTSWRTGATKLASYSVGFGSELVWPLNLRMCPDEESGPYTQQERLRLIHGGFSPRDPARCVPGSGWRVACCPRPHVLLATLPSGVSKNLQRLYQPLIFSSFSGFAGPNRPYIVYPKPHERSKLPRQAGVIARRQGAHAALRDALTGRLAKGILSRPAGGSPRMDSVARAGAIIS